MKRVTTRRGEEVMEVEEKEKEKEEAGLRRVGDEEG